GNPVGGAVVGNAGVAGAIGQYPIKSPASNDLGIGPGVQIASDNTLGSWSPHQGRLYIVYTGLGGGIAGVAGGNLAAGQADATDIFLSFSDDGGRTWSTPSRVNDDNAQADGQSEANSSIANGFLSGRPQFDPAITVDSATGTVVVTYLDARY